MRNTHDGKEYQSQSHLVGGGSSWWDLLCVVLPSPLTPGPNAPRSQQAPDVHMLSGLCRQAMVQFVGRRKGTKDLR